MAEGTWRQRKCGRVFPMRVRWVLAQRAWHDATRPSLSPFFVSFLFKATRVRLAIPVTYATLTRSVVDATRATMVG